MELRKQLIEKSEKSEQQLHTTMQQSSETMAKAMSDGLMKIQQFMFQQQGGGFGLHHGQANWFQEQPNRYQAN